MMPGLDPIEIEWRTQTYVITPIPQSASGLVGWLVVSGAHLLALAQTSPISQPQPQPQPKGNEKKKRKATLTKSQTLKKIAQEKKSEP